MTEPDSKPDDLLARSLSRADFPSREVSLALLAQAQQGDRRALEDLVRRYQDRLRRIVRIQLGGSLLRREYDSMDIVQNAFQAALPKIGDLRVRTAAGILQWLSIIATNQIRDAHDHQVAQRRDARRNEPLSTGPDSTGTGRQIAALGTLPEEHALLAEVRELLDEEVARLPDDQRRVVLLRDYCDEDWDRIASELGRESGAARQLHQRAWIRLRRALKPKLGYPR